MIQRGVAIGDIRVYGPFSFDSKNLNEKNMAIKIFLIGGIAIVSGLWLFLPDTGSGVSSIESKNRAKIRNIALAIYNYHQDFQDYPSGFNELSGNNIQKKVYYSDMQLNTAGGSINIVMDVDEDGLVKVEGKELKLKIAVWTTINGKRLISW